MKKRYTSKRRYGTRKRRIYKKSKGAKTARRMQKAALSFVKKRYTLVLPLKVNDGSGGVSFSISHIGGVNSNAPTSNETITLAQCNPDNQLTTDMGAYQFFRITGIAFKLLFPEGTDPANTAVQWSMGYSSSQILAPNLDFSKLQTLATYQTSSCDSGRPVSRYFKTAGTLARLGIDWCDTREINKFNPTLPAN